MRGTSRAFLWRALGMLLPIVLLSTCTSDQGLAPEHRVQARMDLSGLLMAGSEFPITIDQVEVQLSKHSDPTTIVLDTIISGSGINTQSGSLQVALKVQLDESPEDFDFVAIALAGGVEYYRASGTVTVTDGGTATTPPITPTYTGPGSTADGITFGIDTLIQAGDSALLAATATAGGTAVTGVPIAFASSDSNDVRIRRSPGQAINQAWAVVLATAPGSVTLTAKLPNAAATSGTGDLAYEARATQIVKVSGDAQTVAPSTASAPLVVEVRNAGGQPVSSGMTVTFALNAGPAGATIAPLTAVTDGSGQASTVLTAGATTGAATITASASHGATALTGSPLSFTATVGGTTGPATALNPNSNLNQTQKVNTAAAAPPSVKVVDAGGNGVPGVTVTFAVAAGNGTITGATKVSDAQGIATVTSWTMPQTTGTYSLTASATGLTPLTFTSVATADVAASVAVVSGNNQTGAASSALPAPLVVVVKDQFGNAVSGATVTWATPDGGSLAPASGPTNGTGSAQTVWTLGPTGTTQTVTGTVGALTPATFTATVGLPQVSLSFASIPGVGIGLTATVNITLGTPAPAGGRAVGLVSGNPAFFTVAPASVNIAAGQSTGTATISGVAAGTANLTASATGYTSGTLSVTVQNRSISVPTTLNVPYGQTASLPIQLPAPAPAGGVTFTVVSSTPANVAVESSPVTIAAGSQTANATLDGVLPGPATITVHNAAYIDGTTAAATTAALDIVQGTANPNASFGSPITINFESNNVATAAPAPGITVTLVSRTPACVVATSPVTIATGLVSVGSTVSYGGTAPGLPCTTFVVATAPNLQPDSVQVTVSPVPAITINPLTVGSGLQVNHSFFLGAGNHGNFSVTLTSSDPAVLVSPDASTPGTASIVVPVADGVQSVGFYIQGKEGRTTDTVAATLTATATGFSDGTTTITAVEAATDLQGLPTTTTTLTGANPVYIRLGIANAGYTQLNQLQNLRAGAPASVVATFTTPVGNGAGDLLKKNTAAGNSQTALIPSGVDNTPTDTTSGGVAFRPLAAGTTTVSASIPGFVPTSTGSTRSITVSQPTITTNNLTVGSGLQVNNNFFLGAGNHGNMNVTLSSSDPAVLLSPNSTTPGSSSIVLPVADGTTSVGYYVQGLEGRTTDTVTATITITAPGFSNGIGTITAVEAATDVQGLPTTTTTLTPSSIVYIRLGIAKSGYGQLVQLQNLRAGAPASVVATFTTPAGGVGRLLKGATAPGLSQTALIPSQQDNTPTDTTSGGIAFQPLIAGTTTVFASIPGFVPTTTGSTRTVTVSQPTTSISPLTVGSGLQVNSSFFLGASAHGAINVKLVSSDPRVLLSPNSTTAGTDSIIVPVADGVQSVGYYVQGLEGRTTDTVTSAVVISAPGFSPDTAIMTSVPGAIDMQGLPTSTTTLSPSNAIYVRLGIANQTYTQLNQLQTLRAGGPGPVTATFVTPSNGVGELLKAVVGSSTSQTAVIPALGDNTPTDTTSGGVAFHSLLSGATTVSVTVPGFVATDAATRSITASQPAISTGATTVGSGLQVNTSFFLGAPNHGAINVTVSSSNPALLISKDNVTAGASSITIPVADGVQSVGYYVQGLEGQTGTVTATITVTAPGFTDGTATGTVVQGAIDLQGLPGTTTPFSTTNIIYARLGISDAGHTQLNQLQNLRAGGPGAPTATFTVTPANGVGRLLKAATAPGTTQTAVFVTLGDNTPTDTTSGGILFQPLANGSTAVSVTVPGYVSTNSATRSVTVAAPSISVGSVTVGSGLEVQTSIVLGAGNHGAITLTVTGSDPAILLAPDGTTPGQNSITIPVADGVTSVPLFVAGVEGRTGGLTGTVTVSAPGFVDGTASTSVVQAALDLQGVPATMAAAAPDASIYVRVGTPQAGNNALNALQVVRAGLPGGVLNVTFTSSNTAAATLLTSTLPGAATQTIQIPVGQAQTSTSIATGGVGLHRVAAGTSTISASIPSVITTTNGTDVVTTQ